VYTPVDKYKVDFSHKLLLLVWIVQFYNLTLFESDPQTLVAATVLPNPYGPVGVNRNPFPFSVGLTERLVWSTINRLTPNDTYMGRTAPLTSKCCILYIYSKNTGTEYFKYALYPPFFSLQNAVCFIMLTCLVPVLFTFYIQAVLKLKKKNYSGAKGLASQLREHHNNIHFTTYESS
jgi:hypothetical protein